MKNKWEKLYDDTLKIFPATKYYTGTDFVDKFENKKYQFLKYFEIIELNYSLNRYYHTLFHVNEVLEGLELFKLSDIDNLLLRYSIWFHDIIYDAKKSDNEKESGIFFYDFAIFFGLGHDFGNSGKKLIQLTDHKTAIIIPLGKIICDCDLKAFVKYNYISRSSFVKLEFNHLSDEEWKEGRKNFLKSMINKEHIYHTQKFRDLFEEKARKNLKAEYKYLLENE